MASSSSAQVYDEDDYEAYEEDEDEEEEEEGGGGGRLDGEEDKEEEEEEVEGEEEGEEGEEVEEGEEEEWALLSSSPSPQISRPRAHIPSAPTGMSQNHTHTHTHTQRSSTPAPPVSALQCSPQCSMDDDSSTDASEEHDLLPPPPPPASDMSRKRKRRSERRHSSPNIPSSSPPPPPSLGIAEQQQLDISPATTVHQRKVQIKNLELKFQKECRAHCRTLIALQQQWRQELESPLPGLINGNYLHQQELYKQNGGLHSQTDIQMQNSIVAAPKSRVTSNYKHSAAPAIDDATSTKDKAPRHWYND